MAQDKTPTDPGDEGIGDLSYEQAREELVDIVAKIEAGDVPLEESMTLWERGEKLAAHCQSKLDAAQEQLDQSSAHSADSSSASSNSD